MTGTSVGGIILIMAVVLVGAMAMILWIFVLGDRGSFKHRRTDHPAGDVRGAFTSGTRAASCRAVMLPRTQSIRTPPGRANR